MSGLWAWLTGQDEYDNGYDTASAWIEQGGGSVDGDTIDSIYQSANGQNTPEEFYEGWRDREERKTLWDWMTGK